MHLDDTDQSYTLKRNSNRCTYCILKACTEIEQNYSLYNSIIILETDIVIHLYSI